ncbi:MAG: RidA family protein [Alphaproteobacteria bacterium]|nr:RidA family protein [Alphaproteobacteria bacterium]
MADIKRLDQTHRRARAVIANGFVFLTGQVADDKSGDATVQTRQALAKVEAALSAAGSSKDKIVSAQIWLRSMDDYDAMNAVWDGWVVPGRTPVRCCGRVDLADPAYRIEVVAVGAL